MGYVHVYTWDAGGGIHMWACASEGQRSTLSIFFSHWFSQSSWPESLGSSSLHFPSTGIIRFYHYIQLSPGCWGIQVLTLAQQALYLASLYKLLFVFFFFFLHKGSWNSSWLWSHYVAKNDLEPSFLPSPAPSAWVDGMHHVPSFICVFWDWFSLYDPCWYRNHYSPASVFGIQRLQLCTCVWPYMANRQSWEKPSIQHRRTQVESHIYLLSLGRHAPYVHADSSCPLH